MNTFKEVYLTGIGSGIADIFANTIAAVLFAKFGIKPTIFGLMVSSTIGGIVVLTFALDHQNSWTFPVLVMLTKFGVSGVFAVLYVSHAELWPVLFSATALGLCNTIAKVFAATSPLLAEMREPYPMIIFTTFTALTCLVSLFI